MYANLINSDILLHTPALDHGMSVKKCEIACKNKMPSSPATFQQKIDKNQQEKIHPHH